MSTHCTGGNTLVFVSRAENKITNEALRKSVKMFTNEVNKTAIVPVSQAASQPVVHQANANARQSSVH